MLVWKVKGFVVFLSSNDTVVVVVAITVIELLAPRTAVVRWGPREKYQQQRNRIEATRFGCASVCERMGWGVDIFLSAESASVCCFSDYRFIPRRVGNPLQVQGLRIWYLGVREREGNVIWFGLKIYRQELYIKKKTTNESLPLIISLM